MAEDTRQRFAAKGGDARAAKLSKEDRKRIALMAANARWANKEPSAEDLPRATHVGTVQIGSVGIPCAVLEDGRRLLTQQGFLMALGRARSAKGGQGASVDQLPAFIAAANLKPFIDSDLIASTKPIPFRAVSFTTKASLTPSVDLPGRHVVPELPEACSVVI